MIPTLLSNGKTIKPPVVSAVSFNDFEFQLRIQNNIPGFQNHESENRVKI